MARRTSPNACLVIWLILACTAWADYPPVVKVTTRRAPQVSNVGRGTIIGCELVLTAEHVVRRAHPSQVTVSWSGQTYRVSSYLADGRCDVAVLLVRGLHIHDGKPAPVATSTPVVTSMRVWLLGRWSCVRGFRANDVHGRSGWYWVDGPAIPGDSGSPVLNERGYVVGVVVATDSMNTFVTGPACILDLFRRLPWLDRRPGYT